MATQPPPDTIEPVSPPETPISVPAQPLPGPPEIEPPVPDRDLPDQAPDEEPVPPY